MAARDRSLCPLFKPYTSIYLPGFPLPLHFSLNIITCPDQFSKSPANIANMRFLHLSALLSLQLLIGAFAVPTANDYTSTSTRTSTLTVPPWNTSKP
jgi:hypothetical protein